MKDKVRINGFRPGKVPVGLIKKQYGTQILVDEINKLLNDEIYKWWLKDIIPSELMDKFRTGKVKILVNIIHDPLYDDYNIRQFELQMNELGIDGSNLIFLGGSNFQDYYKLHPESKVKIYNGHLFLRGYAEMMLSFPVVGNLGYICELVDEKDLDEY